MPEFGGLIPDPLFSLLVRFEKLEARLAELEKGKAEPDPKPEQWKLKPLYFNFDSIFEQPQAQWMEEKITRYANQLTWLFKHYPEQNGEWSEINRWSVCQYNSGTWTPMDKMRFKSPTLIYMSLQAALHLAADLNSGKVKL